MGLRLSDALYTCLGGKQLKKEGEEDKDEGNQEKDGENQRKSTNLTGFRFKT